MLPWKDNIETQIIQTKKDFSRLCNPRFPCKKTQMSSEGRQVKQTEQELDKKAGRVRGYEELEELRESHIQVQKFVKHSLAKSNMLYWVQW